MTTQVHKKSITLSPVSYSAWGAHHYCTFIAFKNDLYLAAGGKTYIRRGKVLAGGSLLRLFCDPGEYEDGVTAELGEYCYVIYNVLLLHHAYPRRFSTRNV